MVEKGKSIDNHESIIAKQIGDIDTVACVKVRDVNADGWTYGYFEDGSIVCSTTNVCGK